MLKKTLLSFFILLSASTFQASINDFFYSAQCAGAEYYTLAKKSNQNLPLIKEAHLYTTVLLVHILFPFYLFTIDRATEQDLINYGKKFGKIAHASFVVPALGALIVACCAYFSAKKIIKLIKS